MLMHTETPSIFSSNPRFPLVKFSFSRHRDKLKYRLPSWFWSKSRNPTLKNGNFRNAVNPYATPLPSHLRPF